MAWEDSENLTGHLALRRARPTICFPHSMSLRLSVKLFNPSLLRRLFLDLLSNYLHSGNRYCSWLLDTTLQPSISEDGLFPDPPKTPDTNIMCIYTYIHTYLCVCVYIYIYVCVCMYACMYVCMHVYVHVYKYTYRCYDIALFYYDRKMHSILCVKY